MIDPPARILLSNTNVIGLLLPCDIHGCRQTSPFRLIVGSAVIVPEIYLLIYHYRQRIRKYGDAAECFELWNKQALGSIINDHFESDELVVR